MANRPDNKKHITNVIKAFLVDCFDDPTVEISEPQPNVILIRSGRDKFGPIYYQVKISKPI